VVLIASKGFVSRRIMCLGRVFGIIGTPGIGIVEGRDA
jgi:hypothetical protein